jgi:copper homeostasis protein (lipoprotein)
MFGFLLRNERTPRDITAMCGTARPPLRHNRRMSCRRFASCLLLAACCLPAGCDVARQPASLPLDGGDGRIEWHGTLPCADCDAIEVQLMLERAGDARRYELVETYIAEEGAARFTENGEWRQRDDLIELTGEAGVARRYAVLPDGRLQPRDARGRAFARREHDVLVPTEAFAP